MSLMSLQNSIPYSQVLRFNRICSNNAFIDQICNKLEHWLHKRGYTERFVGQEILKSTNNTKKWENQGENKLTFNITYYAAFRNTKTVLKGLQILLAPDKEHQKAFPSVPIRGFLRGKSLKDNLVRASLLILNNTLGSEPCGKKTCKICKFVVNTDTFSPMPTDETFKISKSSLKCNSKNVVYLSECKKCQNPYVGKTQTKFRLKLNNYKSANKSFRTKKKGIQKLFHEHYVFKMVIKVKTIGNLQQLTGVLQMLNLEIEMFIGNIVWKHCWKRPKQAWRICLW